MAGSPTVPLHSSPQCSSHHRPGAVPASSLTCLAPPHSPRGLRAPATPQRPRSAGLRSRRRGRPAAAPQRTPRRPRSRPPPLSGRPTTPAPRRPRPRRARAAGSCSSRAGAHRDTEALARQTRAAFIDDPPQASHGGAFGRPVGLRLLPLVLRLHGGEEQHLLRRSTPSARARPPACRAPRRASLARARLGPAPPRHAARSGARRLGRLLGAAQRPRLGAAAGVPRGCSPAAPANIYLDVTGIREEHGEAIDSHAPASCRRKAVLQCGAEVFINKHGFIITCGLCLNEKISDKRQGRTELDTTRSTSCHQKGVCL